MRSVSSVLAVSTNRSAKQFARGQRGGIFHYRDAHVGQDRVERRGELAGSIADEEPELGGAVTKVQDKVASLLGSPGSIGVRCHAEDVHVTAFDFECEQHVEPLKCDRTVHVEEVHRQHARRLCTEELAPCGVGVPGRRWRYPRSCGDAADRRCSDPIAEFEQFALDSLVAQVLFSVAIRAINAATVSSIGGRPDRFG